jgi:hypothetical protein
MTGADASSLVVAMATSDCEAIRDAWLAQPANAWSSSAYLLAGGYLLVRHRATAARSVTPSALALGAVAVGSFLFHGPQPAWGDAVHDASISLLLGTLATRGGAAGWARDLLRPVSIVVVVVVVVAAAVLVVVAPWSVAAVHGLLAGLVAISTGRTVRGGGATPAVRVALVAFAVGVVLFAGGRTDGPLCEPRSLAQAHAGWHVATAMAAAALVTTGVRPRGRHATGP